MLIETVTDGPGALTYVTFYTLVGFTRLTSNFVDHVFSGTFVFESILASVALFLARGTGWGDKS